MDEARFGLMPTTRRVWAFRGKRPIAVSRRRFQWSYLYGFVHPPTGELHAWRMPTVNTECFNLVLADFAAEAEAGHRRHIVLVLDGAGWHRSNELQIPDGIELVYLPPYSPELQPAERLWPLVNETIANRLFTDIDVLDNAVEARCVYMADNPEVVKPLTDWHWWPRPVLVAGFAS